LRADFHQIFTPILFGEPPVPPGVAPVLLSRFALSILSILLILPQKNTKKKVDGSVQRATTRNGKGKRDAEETNIWSDTPEVFARKLKSIATP
jgi:hypothetical protein